MTIDYNELLDRASRRMAAGWRGNPHISGDDRNFMHEFMRRRHDEKVRAALQAFCDTIPGLSAVLDGKAAIVPVEISEDDAESIWEATYNVWAEFGATNANAGREAHRASLAASPYRSAP